MSFQVHVARPPGLHVVAPHPRNEYHTGDRALVAVAPAPGVRGGTVSLTGLGGIPGVGRLEVLVQSGDVSQVVEVQSRPLRLVLHTDGTFDVDHVTQPLRRAPLGGPRGVFFRVPPAWPLRLEGRTNALRLQRATLVLDEGPVLSWEGVGEHDRSFIDAALATPLPLPATPAVHGVALIDSSADKGESWQWSKITAGHASVGSFHQVTILSEDEQDRDWNDCVIQVSWWRRDPL